MHNKHEHSLTPSNPNAHTITVTGTTVTVNIANLEELVLCALTRTMTIQEVVHWCAIHVLSMLLMCIVLFVGGGDSE